MKLLTVMVPCYNSEDYMEHCVKTLLPGGERVEILIVDDGSTDRTAEIADRLAMEYPGLVRVIHQENKGHGGAINTGMAAAKGRYFKVVDSDDWVDADAYEAVLQTLQKMTDNRKQVDMFITNFVYEKVGAKHKKVVHFRHALPQRRIFGWNDVRKFRLDQYMLMHNVIYRTRILRDCGLTLPEHTFYVDDAYVYIPLPYVKKMYYLDADLYRYFIGRADQSVNEDVLIKRVDQQLLVNKIMIDAYDPFDFENKHQRKYMIKFLNLMVMLSCSILALDGSEECVKKKDRYWAYIRKKNPRLYQHMKTHFFGWFYNMPGGMGRTPIVISYRCARKVIGFN